MIALFRARLLLAAAGVFALVIFSLEFPFSELLHQRGQLSGLEAQLSTIQARNGALSSEIASLKRPSSVEAIAHQDYGLVKPGELSYVILPAPGKSAAQGVLSNQSLPLSDLVAAPAPAVSGTAPNTSVQAPSLLARFAARLEFWR